MLEAAEPRAKGSVRQPTQLEERHLNGGEGGVRIPVEPERLPMSIMAGVEFLAQWAPTGEVRSDQIGGPEGVRSYGRRRNQPQRSRDPGSGIGNAE